MMRVLADLRFASCGAAVASIGSRLSQASSALAGSAGLLRSRLGLSALLAISGALFLAPTAQALTLSFGLDIEFSGPGAGISPPSSGTTPWVTATFDDSFGGPNTVRLTMAAPNLTGGEGGENIALFHFNFDPVLDPTALSFSAFDVGASSPSVGTGVDSFMADGDGNFDIQFNFPPPPGNNAARFTEGEVVIFDITYTSAIDANSFNFFSAADGGGQGSFLAAAQIQRTGTTGDDSGWIGAVPEPGTALLLGMGLLGLGAWRPRRR